MLSLGLNCRQESGSNVLRLKMWWLGLSLLALGEVCLPQARLTRSLVHAFAARFLAYVNTRTHWHSCIDSIRSCSGRKFSRVCVRACDARLATWRCLGDGERCVRALPAPRAPVFIECATSSPVAVKLNCNLERVPAPENRRQHMLWGTAHVPMELARAHARKCTPHSCTHTHRTCLTETLTTT